MGHQVPKELEGMGKPRATGARPAAAPTRKAARALHLTIGIRRILTRKSRAGKMQNYIPSHM
eukprot:5798433-Prymnesium_polylepis.1